MGDVNRGNPSLPYELLPSNGDEEELSAKWWNYNRNRERSIVTDTFNGQWCVKNYCPITETPEACLMHNFDDLTSINLALPKGNL